MAHPTRVELALTLLDALKGHDSGLGLDDFEHSLQTATRAERAGADDELVVAALLHDTGKAITRDNHGRVAAEMLAGSVRPQVVWMVAVHSDFTAVKLRNGNARHARYRHRLHPGYTLARQFVDEWDLPSRDPDYDTSPIEHFVPLVHEVLSVKMPRRVSLMRRFRRRFRRLVRRRP